MTAQEHPEPIEPTMVSVPGGIYCTVHGEMDCDLPFCWRCGNHLMDDFERCADPRCRASNDPTARATVETMKQNYPDRPVPLEVLTMAIANAYDMYLEPCTEHTDCSGIIRYGHGPTALVLHVRGEYAL